MNSNGSVLSLPSVEASNDTNETLKLTIKGRLDVYTTEKVWKDSTSEIEKSNARNLIIDARGIEYCYTSGKALLIELRLSQERNGYGFEITVLRNDIDKLYRLFKQGELAKTDAHEAPRQEILLRR
ncbi:MAG: lipid asymmetry maintenance protein MlaB [Thermodesulfobacteriota bacterium]